MRRFRWLPWLSSSVVVVGTSLLLGPATLRADGLDESKVKTALMQRFDENRNEKLDAGEARQTRARLKNLLEDKSERELNILTWRDDVRELLQAIDTDGDRRLSVGERDAGRDLLDRLIPAVDPTAPKERETATVSLPKREKETGSEQSRRAGHLGKVRSSSSGNQFGGSIGGGGFGNMNSNSFNPYLDWFHALTPQANGSSSSSSASGASGASGSNAGMSSTGGAAGGASRPGMGDPGSSMASGMSATMGANSQFASSGSMSSLGGNGSSASSEYRPNGSPSGSFPTSGGGNSQPPSPPPGGPMPPGSPYTQGPLGDTQSGTTSVAPSTTPGAGSVPSSPGSPNAPSGGGLGGGTPPPVAGIPGGPGGTSTAPSNPRPNF